MITRKVERELQHFLEDEQKHMALTSFTSTVRNRGTGFSDRALRKR